MFRLNVLQIDKEWDHVTDRLEILLIAIFELINMLLFLVFISYSWRDTKPVSSST